MPIRRKPSGDRVAGLLAERPGVLIRRVEPQVVPALPWIPGGIAYSDAVRYGRATPSRVAEPFAVLIARVWTAVYASGTPSHNFSSHGMGCALEWLIWAPCVTLAPDSPRPRIRGLERFSGG